jgi:NAD(P)-dependent dehydrogenase (short-subunit alcohol dehydrogenase family)
MTSASLRGRRIAITGGGRGIGLATAVQLRNRGAAVVIGDLDQKAAAQAVKSTSGAGPEPEAYRLDVSDYDSFAEFLKLATANGPLDVLINNAGIMPIGKFLDQSIAAHQKAVQVNVLGCIYGMHLALPGMLARGCGHIVNVASTAGKTAVPGGVTYCATKSAVVAMTEAARLEHAGKGVDFTCVMPHFTNTELIAGTTATKLLPVVEPSDVGRAIAKAVQLPKYDVYVPRAIEPLLFSQPLMGRSLRDFINRKIGAYDTFLEFDTEARASYVNRITPS